MKNELEMLVMFEEDRAEQNVTAYIPFLKLGVHGDTIEEARINAMDLVEIEIENGYLQGVVIQIDAQIETIQINNVELVVMFEIEMGSAQVTAYIPALRLGVRGNTIEEARVMAIELVKIELTKKKVDLTEKNVFFDKLKVSNTVV